MVVLQTTLPMPLNLSSLNVALHVWLDVEKLLAEAAALNENVAAHASASAHAK